MIKIRTHKSKIISIFFGILFLVLINGNNYRYNLLTNDNAYNNNEINLKRAGYWEISPIYIDDTDPSYNWSITATTYDWCSGLGTLIEPYLIENITINAIGNDYGFKIANSNVYFRIENCTIYNSNFGSYGGSYGGIILENVSNGTLLENQVSHNYNGIFLMSSSNNKIERNNASNYVKFGILIYQDCDLNEIRENICEYNTDTYGYGIGVTINCDFNRILNNNVTGNTWGGIIIRDGSHNNAISGNNVKANNHGIEIYDNCDNNTIDNNLIINNYGNGGWDRSSSCQNNLWYNNYFDNPGVRNALESGTGNFWDNGTIGNYWSDYSGVDANDDGIGDTPYILEDVIDYFPIWDDGLDLHSPELEILYPIPFELFGEVAPNFNIEVLDTNIDTMWYTLDDGMTNITFSVNGTINQSNWTARGDGPVMITFYANDTVGHVNSSHVVVYKDATSPIININNPIDSQLFGVTAPNFNVEIVDNNLDTMWYTLDDGMTNITFSVNGTINQSNWTARGDGPVMITFYANDTLGHINSAQVLINKDTTNSIINIISPVPDQFAGANSPEFTVEISDPNLDSMWYTIDGGITNIIFTVNDTIDQSNWTAHIDGPITLIFYANDTLAHISSAQVIIIKDTTIPIINIISPVPDQFAGANSPEFTVEISDPNLDSMWYTIDGGLTNISFITNETIDQNNWVAHIDGPVSIIFYANDTAGKTAFSEIIVRKDIEDPIISIITPIMNEEFEIHPTYEITIIELYIDKIWYTFDNGTNKIFITELIGIMDQTLWNQLSNGYVIIRFYANDTLGNISFDDVIVVKDTPTTGSSPPGIPGYNMMLVIGAICIVSVFIIKRKFNKS